jgi:hypothetical protein
MYAQLTYFDRPRNPQQLAAADFAAEQRIKPAVATVPGNVRTYVLRRPDGSEVVVSLAESEQVLIDTQKAIMNTTLLPEEDPALLPGADRVEIYQVHETVEHSGAQS